MELARLGELTICTGLEGANLGSMSSIGSRRPYIVFYVGNNGDKM